MRETVNMAQVIALGVHLMGFIFYKKSPRYTTHAPLWSEIPHLAHAPLPKRVGVFVDAEPTEMLHQIRTSQLDYIQLHGNETPDSIIQLRNQLCAANLEQIKLIKAISVKQENDVKRWRRYGGLIDMLLFDTKGIEVGGTGRKFDWHFLETYDGEIPFLLSGGISATDYHAVREFHHPQMAGVDLNSRFEVSAGVKDIPSLQTFIKGINP